ncbi:MAG: hypothetical protein ACJ749_04785 [Flavisolibacter sp.]
MTKQSLFCICTLFISINLNAQSDTPLHTKQKFETAVLIGFVEGEMGTSMQLQLINGIRFSHTSVGIGAGLDHYAMRSIPLFIDIRQNILKSAKSPFVYADAGINFPWKSKDFEWATDTDSGIFYELGLGYRFPVKSNAVLLNLGYSFKSYAHEDQMELWCLVPPCPVITNHYDFKLRRLSLKLGFNF